MKYRQKCPCGHWRKLLGNEYVCTFCCRKQDRLGTTVFIVAGCGKHRKEFKIVKNW